MILGSHAAFLFLAVAVVYAFLSLDHIAAGHFMFSRPLVVGPLIGWCLGDAWLGLSAGIAVELLWVHVIPVGIWPVDATAMAALSITWTLLSKNPGRPVLVLALCLALPAGILVRMADIACRRQAHRFTPWVASSLEAGREGALGQAVLLGLAGWWVKGLVLFLVLGAAGFCCLEAGLSFLSPRILAAFDFSGRLLPLLAFGSVLNYFFSRRTGGLPWQEKQQAA